MFNIGDMIDQAKELFGGAGSSLASEAPDVGQLLADAGLDADVLAQMDPEEVSVLLEDAGLDPELLSSLGTGGALDALLGRGAAE